MKRDRRLAIWLGGAVWLLVSAVYAAALLARARGDAATAFLYNAPIAFLFLVLLAYELLSLRRLGLAKFTRFHLGTLALWILGFGVLYFRLIARSVEISGHMAWLPMLTLQAFFLGFPTWFVAAGGASIFLAAYMKFALFRGPSGVPGLLVGAVLAGGLGLLHHWRVVEVEP